MYDLQVCLKGFVPSLVVNGILAPFSEGDILHVVFPISFEAIDLALRTLSPLERRQGQTTIGSSVRDFFVQQSLGKTKVLKLKIGVE